MRLQMMRDEKIRKSKTKVSALDTDAAEIELLLSVFMIMSYNRVPELAHYWSHDQSLSNSVIKQAISCNLFQSLASKLNPANPQKPADHSKTYHINEMVECLNSNFRKIPSDSVFQSIDEAMTKFKGRFSIKQYLPMKPIKRGIKIWFRSDSETGYTYDVRVYSGREDQGKDPNILLLGERVITELASTI